MGKILIALILGTALLLLGNFVFGSGVLTRGYQITSTLTSPSQMQTWANGDGDPNASVGTIIAFIIEVVIYFGVAAILTFVFDLFIGKKKEEKK